MLFCSLKSCSCLFEKSQIKEKFKNDMPQFIQTRDIMSKQNK